MTCARIAASSGGRFHGDHEGSLAKYRMGAASRKFPRRQRIRFTEVGRAFGWSDDPNGWAFGGPAREQRRRSLVRERAAYSAGPNTASILVFSVAALNGLTI